VGYHALERSNNPAASSMRPVALGRKNWIHLGSPPAGPKIAASRWIIETCRRLQLLLRDHLAAVLPGLADVAVQRLAELTLMAWAARSR
jgi:transposase